MAIAPSEELAELLVDNPESCLDYANEWYPEIANLFIHEERTPYDYTYTPTLPQGGDAFSTKILFETSGV